MTTSEIPAGVGWTSLITAYGRAQELLAAKPQFTDRFAADFVAAATGAPQSGGEALPQIGPARDDGSSTLWEVFRFYFTQRTPFYDRHVQRAVADGLRQVVFLGAGLDSRAFRLGLPADVTVFEVDQSAVLEFKHEVLAKQGADPTCRRVPLTADITDGLSEPLSAAGFDPSQPVLWVVEGLLMYFTRDVADRLLADVTRLSAPGSRIAGEYFTRFWTNEDVRYDTLDGEEKAAWDLLMRSFRYGPVDDTPADWLASHGWNAGEVTTVTEQGRGAGRPVPPDLARDESADVWLFSGVRA